jgi:tetratricopeptide (TPR) repeat protein
MFYWDTGQGARAEETIRAGIQIYERLYGLDQHNRSLQRYLGRAYSHLGLIVAGRGRSVEAKKIYDQSADLLSRLVKDYPDQFYYRDDLVRTRMRQGTLQDKLGNHRQAAEHYRQVVQLYRQALQLNPKSIAANNSLAWFLATCPELSLRDAREAVRLAKQAIAIAAEPEAGYLWNTLGVAQYRIGDCRAAVESLKKAMALHSGGDGYDWYFLAMAHWRLGNREEARGWLAKGVQWLDKNQTQNEELHRFQAEAQALLSDAAVPVRPSKTPSLEAPP